MRACKSIAADTNVLLDYAAKDEIVVDCFATIRKRISNSAVVVLPTVLHELALLVDSPDESEEARQAAYVALSSFHDGWRFQAVDCLPVEHGIVEEIARKVRDAGLLPSQEFNDSLILAEAALVGASILLSNDGHLLGMDQQKLKEVLEACDVAVPLVASPRKIVRDFFR